MLSVAVLALMPNIGWAEVMDKEPSVVQLWGIGLIWGLVGLLAWRWRVLAGVAATLLGVPLVWAFQWELTDPSVGASIRHEGGQGYVAHAYASMAACLVMHVVGLALWLIRTSRLATTRQHG